MKCSKCHDEFEPEDMQGNRCRWCEKQGRFAAFATVCGLKRFPKPDGDRYVYNVDGSLAGKKSENTDLIDELWNALAKAKGRDDMVIG